MPALELNAADFRAWLEAWGEVGVGSPRETCFCPIAKWLRSLGCPAVVRNSEFEIRGEEIALPRWAVEFVERIDDFDSILVTGRQALAVLDAIEGGT